MAFPNLVSKYICTHQTNYCEVMYLKRNIQIYYRKKRFLTIGMEEQADTFIETLYLESAEVVRVVIKVQTYSQISTKDDTCISDSDYSKSKVIKTKMANWKMM